MAATYAADFSTGRQSDTTSKQTYLDLSPEGFNKIVMDILKSDQGLAALSTGENLSGGYGSSVKAQLAQDLVISMAGELAKITAPTIEKGKSVKKSSSAGLKIGGSVICTELMLQGRLSEELYHAGKDHFLSLAPETVTGYRVWADKVVPLMQVSPLLSSVLAPIARSRYEMIVNKRFGILGAITIYIGQPVCFLIGLAIGATNGNFSRTA
jgi:hypothetical protein